ncbi:phosphoglycerate dehydrogenase [Cryptosporangium sp. NPDC051539]|uniref:phosphoglycerate dehydrogenase n=1 Tax=Cryptosporangium sp. NPDC051539 TaxID=3363962 RepID=UPI0037937DEE
MPQPVVLVAEELAPSALDVLARDFEVRHVDGADRSALLPALTEADAVLVRSATHIDAEALASAPRLKVVARAGVGLDNVDVPAATARGVMVVNAPTSNIVSAAEQAIALLLATARNISPAHAALRGGGWKRSRYTGVEISDKTIGVVGLGRIGVLFAQRMAAFGTRLIAYDPYVQPTRAAQIGVRLVSLEELLAESDFVSIHLPKTAETLGLIGEKELRLVKPTVRIVNAARGGLIDEQALYDALVDGRVAAAGLDVYATEPCTDSPLFGLENVVATPHLGASTVEAQDKAGLAVARSVRLALNGEFVPDAVNVQAGGVVAEEVRPSLPLAEKLGRVFTALASGLARSITVDVRGDIAEYDVSVLELAALKGVFADIVEESVTFVNAPLLAKERGVEVGLTTESASPEYRSLVTVSGVLDDGRSLRVSGTLSGPRRVQKLTNIDAFDIDLVPNGHLLFLQYTDRPGVVGTLGVLLGDAGVNIAGMQVARTAAGSRSLMAVAVDQAVPSDLLQRLAAAIGAHDASTVDLSEVEPIPSSETGVPEDGTLR